MKHLFAVFAHFSFRLPLFVSLTCNSVLFANPFPLHASPFPPLTVLHPFLEPDITGAQVTEGRTLVT